MDYRTDCFISVYPNGDVYYEHYDFNMLYRSRIKVSKRVITDLYYRCYQYFYSRVSHRTFGNRVTRLSRGLSLYSLLLTSLYNVSSARFVFRIHSSINVLDHGIVYIEPALLSSCNQYTLF